MDYELENLGPERFQQFCQALLVSEFPNVVCFPVGQPDGGRDAVRLLRTDEIKTDSVIYQVKYSRNPSQVQDVRKWLCERASGELEKIKRLIARGAKQYVLITNVPGSSHLDAGSIDSVLTEIRQALPISVQCWWRDDLNRRLDGNWDIKLRYPEVISSHDFCRILLDTTTGQERERRLNATRAFLAAQYDEDFEVKFKQVELHNKLLDLFIDLPFRAVVRNRELRSGPIDVAHLPMRLTMYHQDASMSALVITNSDDEKALAGTATLLLSDFGHKHLSHVVIEGAPGQGKSTLAQYLCQVNRIRLLHKRDELDKLPDYDKNSPLSLPFKVDLRDLASWLDGLDPFAPSAPSQESTGHRSLESFLAHLVRHHSGGVLVDINDIIQLSKMLPIMLVLDGLDEVVDIKQRADVVASVTKAIPRLKENCRGLRIIITSRPAAFENSPGFDPDLFPHIDLLSVKRSQIDEYAGRWMSARNLSMKDRQEFETILREKMSAPHMRDLARNPMQLTILLSLILTQGAALPDKRTNLYDEYVNLFFSRESTKSPAVRKHLVLLKDLHRYLGWLLHSTAEIKHRNASGRISAGDLKATLLSYLQRERHRTDIIDELFGTMLERVVMIVPRIQGTYEFEVQPLREYFAARYLYDTASYSPPGKERKGTKPDRFDAIARNFYWLNVVRFFCGCFSKGELLDLADRVKELINDPVLGKSRHPVVLAAMLLSDWVFFQSPKAVAELINSLTTRASLKRLAPARRVHSAEAIIQLPSSCGGREIFNSAFSFLEQSDTFNDQSRQLAQIVRAHATEEEVDQRWLTSHLMDIDRLRWLRVGSFVGSLSRVDKAAILVRLGNFVISQNSALILCSAGRYDCVLTSETNASLVTSLFLSARLHVFPAHFGNPPFYLVPMLIGTAAVFQSGISNWNLYPGVREALQRFSSEREARMQSEFDLHSDFFEQCFMISTQIYDVLMNPEGFRPSQWANLIEQCRKLWGTRPSIIFSALRLSNFKTRAKPKVRYSDILDNTTPICSRLLAAGTRRTDQGWWREQFQGSTGKPFSARLTLYLAFFSLAAPEVLFALGQDVSSRLNSLPADEWAVLLHVSRGVLERGNQANGKRSTVEHMDISRLASPRFAYFVALREPTQFAIPVFLKYFVDCDDVSVSIGNFRQVWSMEAASAGRLDWGKALEIVRSTYARGSLSSSPGLYTRPAAGFSEALAAGILAKPEAYPAYLWDFAESFASARARNAIRAVGTVAKNEKWFSA